MQLKKRYIIPIALLLITYGIFQMEFFTMRLSDEAFGQYLKDNHVSQYSFHDYDFEGRNIHYVHVGEEQSNLIVFIHGSPGSADAYKEYLCNQRLTQQAQMVSVDRPGFGFSDYGKTEKSLEKQAEAIIPIIKKHKKGKVILVGHSLGGPLIARMAMDFPNMIDGLAMVAPSIDPELEPNEWWRALIDNKIFNWFLPSSLRVCNQEIIPLQGELKKMLPLWKNIEIPTIVIQGENDELVPAANSDFAKRMLVNCSRLTLDIVKKGNHFILWSKQKRITDSIISLIEER